MFGMGTVGAGLLGWAHKFDASRSDGIIANLKKAVPPQPAPTPRRREGQATAQDATGRWVAIEPSPAYPLPIGIGTAEDLGVFFGSVWVLC